MALPTTAEFLATSFADIDPDATVRVTVKVLEWPVISSRRLPAVHDFSGRPEDLVPAILAMLKARYADLITLTIHPA